MVKAPIAFVLVRLRYAQLRRALPGYGIVLLGLAICAAVWLLRSALLSDASYAPHIAAGALLSVWGLHQRRRDLPFLHRHVRQARLEILLEYGTLVLPVALALMLTPAWPWSVVALLSCALPWLPVARSSGVRARWLRNRIPAPLFEWKSMLQGAHPWTLLLWLAALAFCWLPLLPLLLLGLIALMAAGAQEQCEPRAMLLATAPDARTLLRNKLLGAARIMLAVELPVLIGATFFQPGWWWIHVLFGAGMLVLACYAVGLKYANYHPNARLDANSANVGVAAVFAILPGLGLVPLIMLLSELRKARENLNSYFHADHH